MGHHTAEAFYSTSKYLDDLLNTDNPYFEGMVNQIYPPELQLNKANASDTESPLDLHLSDSNGFVSSAKYINFDFGIVNFPFLDGDVPCRPFYGVYIAQLIRFATVSIHVTGFNARKLKFNIQTSTTIIDIINYERCFQNFIPDTMN